MEMQVVRVSGNGQQALMTDGGVAHMRALDAIIHLDLISDLDAEAIKTGTLSEQADADRIGSHALLLLLLLHSDLQTVCSRLWWWILSHHALIWMYPIPTARRPTSVRRGPTPITAVSDRTRAWRDEWFYNGGSITMVRFTISAL
ncbi:hypothetical protein MUK42_33186 [Musa troglodytarum]|uniref:Uncharacterized protein n=1 Tax=Musa troglodytarum TaxID=320322 RepID=A0A9E7EML6_9LILI|nr:hypothetical protein MUK42_33186 [Musa troglodytarum]